MTQIFDTETGVVTPVTVIQAGPCPVVQVKTMDTDGYEAVQLAFDVVPERKISKGELGHWPRTVWSRIATWSSSAAVPS